MEGLAIILFTIYIVIILQAGLRILIEYNQRRLVKANFWCNVSILALLALLTLIVIIEFYLG